MSKRCVAGLVIAALGAAFSASWVSADTPGWRPLKIDGHTVRWRRPADGVGQLVLRWRMVERTEAFEGAVNCRRMSDPKALLAASGLDEPLVRSELNVAFAMWQQATDIVFIEAVPGAGADIIVGAQAEPVGRAYADVAYDRTATGSERAITRSLVCLNPRMRWKVGYDGNLDIYDLRYTFAHEIGHALGLDHAPERGSLMWFRYDEGISGLQPGDLAGAAALYGRGAATSAPADWSARLPPPEARFGLR